MTYILGISAYYHDSAAALVVDGDIVAAAQEEPTGFFDTVRAALARPRFSFAGVAAVAIVAVLAFMLGRQGGLHLTKGRESGLGVVGGDFFALGL